MPTFQITGPDGKKYRITGETAEGALAALQKMGSGSDQPSTIEDVAKSGASGAARGVADFVGLPGTIADAVNSGGQYLLRKGYQLATGEAPSTEGGAVERFFAGPSEEVKSKLIGGGGNPLSGEKLKEGLSTITSGATDYQPKTTAGKYARTIGEFLPGAIGPGGLIRKGAQVVLPALASETAGQATENTPIEPYARIIGALAGGGISGIGIGKSIPKTPSAEKILSEGGNAYEAAKPVLKSVRVSNPAYRDIVDALKTKADDFGVVPEVHGPATSFLARQEKAALPTKGVPGATGAEPSLYDLELARRGLGHIGSSNITNKSLGALSGQLRDTLDEAVENLPASALSTGTATAADDALKTLAAARETWKTGRKAELVDNAVEAARNGASGFENGLRIEFRKLLKEKNARNFNETELNAIKAVARGTFTQNALRWLGGFGVPTDSGRNFLGSVMGALSGNAVGGPAGAVLLPAAGTAAKIGASNIAERNAAIVDALVKGGSKGSDLYRKSVGAQTQARRQAIARALIQSLIAGQTGGVPLATPR